MAFISFSIADYRVLPRQMLAAPCWSRRQARARRLYARFTPELSRLLLWRTAHATEFISFRSIAIGERDALAVRPLNSRALFAKHFRVIDALSRY